MTHRIKPLVWEKNGDFSFLGRGFGGCITIMIDLRSLGGSQAALELAKARHEAEYQEWLSAALEPTDPLADAMKLPEIKALVAAATNQLHYMDMCGDKGDNERNLRAALAALTKEGE